MHSCDSCMKWMTNYCIKVTTLLHQKLLKKGNKITVVITSQKKVICRCKLQIALNTTFSQNENSTSTFLIALYEKKFLDVVYDPSIINYAASLIRISAYEGYFNYCFTSE